MAEPEIPREVPWTNGTDIRDVIEYAAGAHENALILYLAACRKQDTDAMDVCVKQLRHVATRLDQYKRVKLKQWNSPARDSSQSETTPT